MRAIIGIISFLVITCLALYVGFYQGILLGIVAFVEGCKADPVSAWDIAIGVVRFWIGPVVGWGIFILGNLISRFLVGKIGRGFRSSIRW